MAEFFRTPGAQNTIWFRNSKAISASNTTASIILWRVTGTVWIAKLGGVVTTNLSNNHTAAHFRVNDQTATPAITLATGTTMSSLLAGSSFAKTALTAVALTKFDNAAGVFSESATAGIPLHAGFQVVKKTAANTDIEYRYTTTNTPATGQIEFFCEWIPISSDGALVAQ